MFVVKRAQRLLDDELHADGRGQVDDDVALVHQLVDDQLVEHRALHEPEVRDARPAASRLPRRPVDRLSRTTTRSPSASSVSTR